MAGDAVLTTDFIIGRQFEPCVLDRYVRQFREIFTEEGRRQVKITHQVPGRAPVVTYTQVCNTAAMTTTKSATAGSAVHTTSSTAKVDLVVVVVIVICNVM